MINPNIVGEWDIVCHLGNHWYHASEKSKLPTQSVNTINCGKIDFLIPSCSLYICVGGTRCAISCMSGSQRKNLQESALSFDHGVVDGMPVISLSFYWAIWMSLHHYSYISLSLWDVFCLWNISIPFCEDRDVKYAYFCGLLYWIRTIPLPLI